LAVLLAVHDSEPHGAWHKNVIVLATDVGRLDLRLVHILMLPVLLDRLQRLQLVLLRILVTVVGHVASTASLAADGALLVVAVKVLDV